MKEQLSEHPVSRYVSLVMAAVGALGAGKALLEIGSGNSISLQEFAFYVGSAGVCVWLALIPGGIAAGVLEEWLGTARNVALAGGITVWAIAFLFLAIWTTAFEWGAAEDSERNIGALIGVVAIAVGLYEWHDWRSSRGDKQEEATQ